MWSSVRARICGDVGKPLLRESAMRGSAEREALRLQSITYSRLLAMYLGCENDVIYTTLYSVNAQPDHYKSYGYGPEV